jgi:hypothetical protein
MDRATMFLTLMAQALKVKQSYTTCEVDTNTRTIAKDGVTDTINLVHSKVN